MQSKLYFTSFTWGEYFTNKIIHRKQKQFINNLLSGPHYEMDE